MDIQFTPVDRITAAYKELDELLERNGVDICYNEEGDYFFDIGFDEPKPPLTVVKDTGNSTK